MGGSQPKSGSYGCTKKVDFSYCCIWKAQSVHTHTHLHSFTLTWPLHLGWTQDRTVTTEIPPQGATALGRSRP